MGDELCEDEVVGQLEMQYGDGKSGLVGNLAVVKGG